MSLTEVGTPTSGNGGAGTPLSFATSFPDTPADGDIAVIFGHMSGNSLTMSLPAGWDPPSGITNPFTQGTASRLYVWTKTLAASESAPTITNSGSLTGGWECHMFRGAGSVRGLRQGTSGTSVTLPTLTGCVAGSKLLTGVHARVASGTIPTGITPDAAYTEAIDHATSRSTANANVRMETTTRDVATAGDYGGETFSVTNSISSSMAAALVEIIPAVASVTLTPATATFSAVATTADPGPVTVALTAASGSFAGVAVTATPGPVTATLAPASGAWVAVGTNPVPQPVTVALSPVLGAFSAVPVSPVPGPVTFALSPASGAFVAVPLGGAPAPGTVVLTAAVAGFAAVALGTPASARPIPDLVSVDRPAAAVAAGGAPTWVTSAGDRLATEVRA